jgi:AraC-like DNA-binding protein
MSQSIPDNVEPIGVRLTISAYAREFGVSRDTVTRRFEAAGISPVGLNDKGYPVYKLVDAAKSILGVMTERASWDDVDPARLHPSERAQLAKAKLDETRNKLENLKVESAEGDLVSVHECREEMALMKNAFVQALDTLPDVLERDCGLDPDQVTRVEQICDQTRIKLAEELMR